MPEAGARTPSQDFEMQREEMVRTQLKARGIHDARVLEAMTEVPRHLFVPEDRRSESYDDHPLPIGEEQTISQPYIVALMSQLAQLQPSFRVLEIGTGSGYQAAVLAGLVDQVFSIEIIPTLAQRATRTLNELGLQNVTVRIGDGYQGWPGQEPFDAILVTAAPPGIPQPLLDQLRVGGRLVIPVGPTGGAQKLLVVERTVDGWQESRITAVRFVPMTGTAQDVEN